jgi:hypothetical protein
MKEDFSRTQYPTASLCMSEAFRTAGTSVFTIGNTEYMFVLGAEQVRSLRREMAQQTEEHRPDLLTAEREILNDIISTTRAAIRPPFSFIRYQNAIDFLLLLC